MDAADTTARAVLLEALFFAGGLRTQLHRADARPAWVPAFERVGLHNDVYPAPGQFIADLSRFPRRPAHGGAPTATWYGIYGHAVDLHGDRGVFCGVGLWVAGSALVDSESIYDMLLSLTDMLQRTRRDDGRPTAAFDAAAARALGFVHPSGVLRYAGSIDSADTDDIARATQYVPKALAELAAGKPVSVAVSRPYGCSVKYAG